MEVLKLILMLHINTQLTWSINSSKKCQVSQSGNPLPFIELLNILYTFMIFVTRPLISPDETLPHILIIFRGQFSHAVNDFTLHLLFYTSNQFSVVVCRWWKLRQAERPYVRSWPTCSVRWLSLRTRPD